MTTRTKDEILQEIQDRRFVRKLILQEVGAHQARIDELMDILGDICTPDEMFEVYKEMIQSAFEGIK